MLSFEKLHVSQREMCLTEEQVICCVVGSWALGKDSQGDELEGGCLTHKECSSKKHSYNFTNKENNPQNLNGTASFQKHYNSK